MTFKNVDITFTTDIRNAIVANGHTLTLDNVVGSNMGFNLFCGGMIKPSNVNSLWITHGASVPVITPALPVIRIVSPSFIVSWLIYDIKALPRSVLF